MDSARFLMFGDTKVIKRPKFVAGDFNSSSSVLRTSNVYPVPTGINNQDLLIAILYAKGGGVGSWIYNTSVWSEVTSNEITDNNLTILTRVANNEPSSYTFSTTNSRYLGGGIFAFRFATVGGVSPNATTTGTILDSANISVPYDRSLLIAVMASDAVQNLTMSASPGMTKITNTFSVAPSAALYYKEVESTPDTGSVIFTAPNTSLMEGIIFSLHQPR